MKAIRLAAILALALVSTLTVINADVHAKLYNNSDLTNRALTLGGNQRCTTFIPVTNLYPVPTRATEVLFHEVKEASPQSRAGIPGNAYHWHIDENISHNLPYGDVFEIFLTPANPSNWYPTSTAEYPVQFFPFSVDDVNITPKVTSTSVLRRALILTGLLDTNQSDAFMTVALDDGEYIIRAGQSLLIHWELNDPLYLEGRVYLGRPQGGRGTMQIRPVVISPEFYPSYVGEWELVYETSFPVGPV